MDFLFLNLGGALFTFLFGVWAIFQAPAVSKFLALSPYSKRGTTEIRATYGGWMCGLSGFALFNQSAVLFQCLGFGWLAAGLVRTVAMLLIDDSYSKKNLNFVIFEFITAVCLLL